MFPSGLGEDILMEFDGFANNPFVPPGAGLRRSPEILRTTRSLLRNLRAVCFSGEHQPLGKIKIGYIIIPIKKYCQEVCSLTR